MSRTAAESERSLRRGRIWGALLLALAACRGAPAPDPDASAPPPAEPGPQPAAGPLVRDRPELCAVLAGVVATEPEGFARLRGRSLAAERWLGREVLPGTERCTIEGEAWPQARYSCAGAPFAADREDGAQVAFDALATEIDQCLDSPICYPRTWQRGNAFEFAMGERLQAWTDHSTSPPSQVVLKVQQDASGRAYRVKLDLEAVP